MPKNIVIFFASPYKSNAKAEIYKDAQGLFSAKCTQTNETALRYISWKLAQQEQKINVAYAFTTKVVSGAAWKRLLDELQETEYAIKPIYFDESSTIEGSFNGINIMYDVLTKNYPVSEEITVHMDLTGGFRHSTILMLDLLRLMKFAGYKVGLITYTNFNEKRIETVNELVEMFDLLGGASDFTNNGSVAQLQSYFSKQKQSVKLQKLLKNMERFSECIKSCSKRETLLDAAKSLQTALEEYKLSLKNISTNVSGQERLFSCLLTVIEKEYADIFTCDNTTASIPKLIRWCLNKGLLQQAATYSTELLPVYLIDSGLLQINDNAIIEHCKQYGKAWSNWQVEFLKNYQCKGMKAAKPRVPEAVSGLDYSTLRILLDQQYSAAQLQTFVGSNNQKLEAFFSVVDRMDREIPCNTKAFLEILDGLQENNLIKYIFCKIIPANNNIEAFVTTRLKNCHSIDKMLVSALKLLGRKETIEIFNLAVVSTASVECKPLTRGEKLLNACNNEILSTKLEGQDLIDFVNNYVSIVQYRNSISHADGKTQGIAENQSLRELIAAELDLLENVDR